MTNNSHSRGPHNFPYCRKFCKHGGKIMTKFELVADTCLLPLRIQQLLILLWIAVDPIRQQYPHRNTSLSRLIFSPTHHSLRFGPTARTFGVENPSIFRPHIVLINRVKKSTLVQIGLQLYLSTLFCSSTLFLLVLNTTACTMHCISGAMSFSPERENRKLASKN